MVINYYYIINRIRRMSDGHSGQGGHPLTLKKLRNLRTILGIFFGILERGVSTFCFIENNELQEEKQSKLSSIY